jgi:hypothetical protein
VGVDVGGDGDAGVAEEVADDLERDALDANIGIIVVMPTSA